MFFSPPPSPYSVLLLFPSFASCRRRVSRAFGRSTNYNGTENSLQLVRGCVSQLRKRGDPSVSPTSFLAEHAALEREGGRRGKFCLPRAEEKEEEEESSSYGTMKVTLPGISVVLAARFATIGDVWVILLLFRLLRPPLPFSVVSRELTPLPRLRVSCNV